MTPNDKAKFLAKELMHHYWRIKDDAMVDHIVDTLDFWAQAHGDTAVLAVMATMIGYGCCRTTDPLQSADLCGRISVATCHEILCDELAEVDPAVFSEDKIWN